MAVKHSFSAFFVSRFQNFFFDGKRNRAFKNAQIWLKISILIPYCVFNKANKVWMVLSFGDFVWHSDFDKENMLVYVTNNTPGF